MIFGYARVSTMVQAHEGNSIEPQICALKQAEASSMMFSATSWNIALS